MIKKTYNYFTKGGGNRQLMLYSFIIGIFSGLVASLFYFLLELFKHFFNVYLTGKTIISPAGETLTFDMGSGLGLSFLYFFLPAFGGLVSGILVYFYAPSAKGNGTDAMIKTFHKEKGELKPMDAFIKAVASLFVISTNGSSGREGPILQVCGGIGSYIARITKKNTIKTRIFLLAGAAGGLGAIFRAPLGGALTSIEVLYKEDFETEALFPCIVSSVTAYTVFTLIFGHQPIFSVTDIGFSVKELPLYLILGLICAGAGHFYLEVLDYVKTKADLIKTKPYLVPMYGGLLAGFVGFFVPQALGSGAGFMQEALFGKYTMLLFLLIAIAKIFTTSFTIGSGGSGGVFGPTLVIGAMLGGFVASAFNYYSPGLVMHPASFIVVGMASFFAGVASAPIASILMVCEITKTYELLPPLLLVSVVSILLTKKSIFKNQVKNKLFSMAHHQEATESILKQKKVRDNFKEYKEDDIVVDIMPLNELIDLINTSHNSDFIVIDKEGKLVGGISLADCEAGKSGIGSSCDFRKSLSKIARKISFVTLDDDLYTALNKFLHEPFYKLPVVDERGKVRGYLRYRDILTAL